MIKLPLKNIFILTGAGISAESGIATFRGTDGLWNNYRIEDVATPAAFNKDPSLIWKFYFERIDRIKKSKPNDGHYAIKNLISASKNIYSITQNVDNLHEKAGIKNVIHMHGDIMTAFCPKCKKKYSVTRIKRPLPICKKCNSILRPNVVWFGEIPLYLEKIYNLLTKSSVFISIGTSGNVYPAAEFHLIAKSSGARTVFINLEDTGIQSDLFFLGKAGIILPQLFDKWISKGYIEFNR
ncbi:NAD-dependent protein deacylase [candidate division TA06 bacterium]|uniref:protein acetyllysine N-acetyltransferase n=1 Tax=candidate division TA06 bacterium TaxID=2250710 RepID=A0A660SNP1_UNCT6|nr:MAG: NAD-dependent protein deacylase [candidate division TA06 bacterium]